MPSYIGIEYFYENVLTKDQKSPLLYYSLVKGVTVIHRISARPKAACVIMAVLEPAAEAAEAQ